MKAFTEMSEKEIQTICRTIISDTMGIQWPKYYNIKIVDVDVFHITWKLKTVYFTYSTINFCVSVTSADGDEEISICDNLPYSIVTRLINTN